MLFDEDFLAKVSDNPVTGVIDICRLLRNNLSESTDGWTHRDYEILIETYALLTSLEEIGLIESDIYHADILGNAEQDCSAIYQYINSLESHYNAEASQLRLQSFKTQFKANLGGFSYEFSQGDLDRIQALVNELREHVSKSTDFEQDHKRRLLSRLEKLQAELHKKMSDLDKFWGLIGDAGVAVGKFGNDVKPIVDRIKEITEIVWRTQARAEELPSDTPLPRLEDRSQG